MNEIYLDQWTLTKIIGGDSIKEWIGAFLIDRKVQNLAPGTLYFYESKLKLFSTFCELIDLSNILDITPDSIRKYLFFLEQKGHNSGGIHAGYRTLRTFLNWWEQETEPDGWKNPIRKVKAPKIHIEPLEPVSINHINKLLSTCSSKEFHDLRDYVIMLFLLDTGARASELCALNLQDIDIMNGSVLIRSGKGGKPRTVFLGKKSRKALRAYLRIAVKNGSFQTDSALWVTQNQTRLTYWGLNEILRRRAASAKIKKPGLHDFRRAFALNFLRNGGDIYSLQNLMGHADLQVLRRYLAQTTEDLQIAHQNFSPVDNSGL